MKTLVVFTAIVALVIGAAVAPAHAVIIEFSTKGSFNGGPFSSHPTLTMWPGYGTLEFIGLTDVTVDAGLGSFSLGALKVSGLYGATHNSSSGESTSPEPLPFAIKVIHASPSPSGHDTVGGFMSGSFGSDWSTLKVTLTDSTAAMDGYLYEVHAITPPALFREPLSVNADLTVVPVVPVTTPEPSTLLLVGTGLTGLAGVVRRKLSRRQP